MIINNVAVSPVCAFWHITMCTEHVSQLIIIKLWFINLFGGKCRYTSATLSRGLRIHTLINNHVYIALIYIVYVCQIN